MGLTRIALRRKAKALAQDSGQSGATGLRLLLTDTQDYDLAIDQALALFNVDKPNVRQLDVVMTVEQNGGFLIALSDGSLLPAVHIPPFEPPVAALANPAAAGNISAGARTYRATFIEDAAGERETEGSEPSDVVTVADPTVNGKVEVVLPEATPTAIGCKLYRTKADDLDGEHLYAGTQLYADSDTFLDDVADSALGVPCPEVSTAYDPDAWVTGWSRVQSLWWPFVSADQAAQPLDTKLWRIVRGAEDTEFVELLTGRLATGDVVRLQYTTPHYLDKRNSPALTTIREGDIQALATLTAIQLLTMAANKAAQNTGTTGLPSDVVDRRTQSDQFRSRANDLQKLYNTLVGKGAKDDLKGASAFADIDTEPSWNRFGGRGGFILH